MVPVVVVEFGKGHHSQGFWDVRVTILFRHMWDIQSYSMQELLSEYRKHLIFVAMTTENKPPQRHTKFLDLQYQAASDIFINLTSMYNIPNTYIHTYILLYTYTISTLAHH